MTVKMIYKTEQGTTWTTMQEAMLADVIEQSSVYMESYRLKDLVEKITEKLYFSLKDPAERMEKQDLLVLSGKMIEIPISKDDCCVNYHKDDGELG